ncbi:MAG: hypothetical protein H7A51_12535 [Akkermansiaceae bacterium]|nr:hypothetical protein [Akkermansiaceae bacterium]
MFIHPGKKSGDVLPYDAAFRLKAGHRLVAIHPDGRRDEGTLLFSAATADAYTTTMGSITLTVLTRTKEYQDRLPAGCPVLDTQTGRVVGTLVTNWSSRKPYEPYQASDHYYFPPDPAKAYRQWLQRVCKWAEIE